MKIKKDDRKKSDKKRLTEILLKKKEEKIFNPLVFLGNLLKEMGQNKSIERSLSGTDGKPKRKTVKIIEEIPQLENNNEEEDFSP